MTDSKEIELKPCPFCGGEADVSQTGKYELTLRCVGKKPSGLLGCGPKLVQKITGNGRFTLGWLTEKMADTWNSRIQPTPQPHALSVLDDATKQKLREALRFSASRSVMSSDDERRILSAMDKRASPLPANNGRAE